MRDGWQAGGVVDAPRALSREDEEPDAQLSLRWSQDLARALVDHSWDVILVLTADHRCLFANPAIRDRLGYEPDEVLGQNVVPLHHPDDLPCVVGMLTEAAAHPGSPAHCHARLLHRDGFWRWMSVTAANRLADSSVQGIICNLHDVTVLTEAAATAETASRAQAEAMGSLERVSMAKSEYLRLLAHEFKTPLAVVAGNAELAAMESPDRPGVLESTTAI